ncbi:hypothetical protein MXEN_02844 [Mycobacterium xenopi RIVM700367]|nr:hypothetical protein MXEN_02844 [Mycobacterium xenopi RIVM700367]
MTAPATMQSAAMRRSGAMELQPATMQSAAMRRSGVDD